MPCLQAVGAVLCLALLGADLAACFATPCCEHSAAPGVAAIEGAESDDGDECPCLCCLRARPAPTPALHAPSIDAVAGTDRERTPGIRDPASVYRPPRA